MLYETLAQNSLLLIFLACGFCGGLIFDIGNFIKFLFANKKPACVVLDIICTVFCCILLFFVNLSQNFGVLRLFPVVIFLLAFSVERFTLGKIIAKIYLVCYTFLTKLAGKLTKRIKHGKANKND